MKKNRALKFITAFLFLCVVLQYQVFAQVAIIRQPPATGVIEGAATWSEPYPDSAVVRETGSAEFKGRLSIGGRGGQDKYGDALYDLATDSYVAMIQPLGEDALLSIDANLLRFQSSVKEDQNYNGVISLEFERLQFETSGGYKQTFNDTAELESDDTDWWISAAFSSGLLETMPMSLDYQSTWIERNEDSSLTDSKRTDELNFKTAGTVSIVGVELDADLEYEDDREEDSENLGSAGNLKIIIPIGKSIGLQFNEAPVYNRSENSTDNLRSVSLDSGLGLNWFFNENLQANMQGGRIDAWTADIDEETDIYQNSWTAGLALDYQPPEGFFCGPSYRLAKAVGGNWTHSILLPAGWTGQGAVKGISVKGASTLIRADTGDRVKDAVDWMLTAALLPSERMNFNGDYMGGFLWLEEAESWNHKMSIEFSHNLDPYLNYRGAYTLSNNQEDESEDLWKQQGIIEISITPRISNKIYTFDISETLDLSNGSSGDDILSAAAMKLSIPFGAEFNTFFGLQWEWINRISVDGDPGNQMQYFTGLSIAGNEAPFSLNTEYSFAHGYRGFRHDVTSLINVPLGRGYAIETVFTLNNYYEDNQSKLYWLLGLNLVYEF